MLWLLFLTLSAAAVLKRLLKFPHRNLDLNIMLVPHISSFYFPFSAILEYDMRSSEGVLCVNTETVRLV